MRGEERVEEKVRRGERMGEGRRGGDSEQGRISGFSCVGDDASARNFSTKIINI